MIYSQEERLPYRELESIMLERLRATVERVYDKVPMYRKKFDAAGIKPTHFESLSDLSKFPFTTKADLRDNYPFNAIAVPPEKLARVHASAGTTGKPILTAYTRKDLDTWAELMARSLTASGVRQGDIIQNSFEYGLGANGLGIHYGAERIGAIVIPVSEGKPRRQIMLLDDLKPAVLCCTPSLALQIANVMRSMGVLKDNLGLRIGIFGGESWSEGMCAELEDLLNIQALDIYGLSEMFGPGVACECVESKSGPHIFMDHFLPEIINPVTGAVLKPGEQGELALTSLTKEGLPLVRYRTRDITRLNPEQCKCGRTAWRMARIVGRTDDMLSIGGVNLFPSQIEAILLKYAEVEPRYTIEVDRINSIDTLTVTAEVTDAAFSAKEPIFNSISKHIEDDMLDMLGVRASIRLEAPHSIESKGEVYRRVVDKRRV